MLEKMKKDFRLTTPAPAIVVGASLLVLFTLLYWESINQLLKLWSTHDTYSHGLLVFFITIYLIVTLNKPLTRVRLKPAPLLLLPLSFIIFLWLLSSLTDTQTIELTLLPLIFIFAYISITGYQAARLLIPSLSYILIATPIWDILIPLFQSMAILVNEIALKLSGIPTYIKGTTVSIPAGTFDIEGGCAGIRYLIVTLALGGFYSLQNFKKLKPALILMTASLILPIIFNWIRIYIIIVIGHFTDMQSSLVHDHNNFGWFLYGISLIPLYFIAQRLTKKDSLAPPLLPVTHTNKAFPKAYILLPILLITSAPSFTLHLNKSTPDVLQKITAPVAADPWRGPIYNNEWKPDYKGASIEVNKLYIGTREQPNISLHLFYYGQQSQDSELINELNSIAAPKTIKHKKIINLNQYSIIENLIIDNNSKKHLVWYWYFIDNTITSKPTIAKLLQSKEIISGTIRSSLLAIKVSCEASCNSERKSLQLFLRKHQKEISNSLSR